MKKLIVLLIAGFLFTGTSLFAQPSNNMKMGMKPHKSFAQNQNFRSPLNRIDRMKQMLNLTDAQVSKITDLKFKLDNEKLDITNAIQKNRLLVRKMMADKKVNSKELLKLTKKNSSLKGQLSENRIKMWLDVYNLLDKTQQEKWIDMFGHFSGRMMGKPYGKGMPKRF